MTKSQNVSNKTSFAEIVESSATHCTLHSWQLDVCPPRGSLVLIDTAEGALFGVISSVATGCPDGAAVVHPYRQTQEQLRADHPEIFEFLQTTASCLLIGSISAGQIVYNVSGKPAPIHAFVREATREEYVDVFSKMQWVPVLCGHFQHGSIPDELFIAILMRLRAYDALTQDTLEQFLDVYAALTDGEYRHLRLFVQRIAQLIR